MLTKIYRASGRCAASEGATLSPSSRCTHWKRNERVNGGYVHTENTMASHTTRTTLFAASGRTTTHYGISGLPYADGRDFNLYHALRDPKRPSNRSRLIDKVVFDNHGNYPCYLVKAPPTFTCVYFWALFYELRAFSTSLH
jgi:hypothetical protein